MRLCCGYFYWIFVCKRRHQGFLKGLGPRIFFASFPPECAKPATTQYLREPLFVKIYICLVKSLGKKQTTCPLLNLPRCRAYLERFFSDSNGFCALKRNGTEMTQIDTVYTLYILFFLEILILNRHVCPPHGLICSYVS